MADCVHGCLSAPFLGPIRMTMKEYEKDTTHNMKRTEEQESVDGGRRKVKERTVDSLNKPSVKLVF